MKITNDVTTPTALSKPRSLLLIPLGHWKKRWQVAIRTLRLHLLPKKPLALTTRKCSIFSTKHFSLAQFAQTRVSLLFSWHRLVKHASLGTDKLRPPAWRSGTDVKSPVAVEALSCELACTLRYVTIIFTFLNQVRRSYSADAHRMVDRSQAGRALGQE